MFIDIVLNFIVLFIKYTLGYFYFFLAGRSFLILINKFFLKEEKLPKYILFTKREILYPIFGLVLVGNILVILNYWLALKSPLVYLVLLFLLIPNLYYLSFKLNINITFLLYYIFIPSILIISSSNITFNYDAGYYHLLHQNWLRESNLILGMVNIFWPFGMSSIYEYISAILWFDNSFIYLHFLNIIFIHFFYLFLSQNLIHPKYSHLKTASLFILIYSLLDNFGVEGGRNGFLYIQGVGKQDVSVGVLVAFISTVIIYSFISNTLQKIDYISLSLLSLFLFQIKVSSVIIFYIYLIFMYFIYKYKNYSIKTISFLHFPVLLMGIISLIKSYLTTGCLIFPLNLTCINSFDWYLPNSTIAFERITKHASIAYDFSMSFTDWLSYVGSFEYNKSVFINYLGSLFILLLIKYFLFKSDKRTLNFKLIVFSYLIFSFLYLVFFGPIPRYAIGLCITSISCLAFFIEKPIFEITKTFSYFLIFFSVLLLVRSTSYNSLLTNQELQLFDPRTNVEINEVIGFKTINENWVIPTDGDQCWANLECSMAKSNIIITENEYFKKAYK